MKGLENISVEKIVVASKFIAIAFRGRTSVSASHSQRKDSFEALDQKTEF